MGTLHWWGFWLLGQWIQIKQLRCLSNGRNGGLVWCLMGSFQILKFLMNWKLERSFCRVCLRINILWWLCKQVDISLPRIRFNSRVISYFNFINLPNTVFTLHEFILGTNIPKCNYSVLKSFTRRSVRRRN